MYLMYVRTYTYTYVHTYMRTYTVFRMYVYQKMDMKMTQRNI